MNGLNAFLILEFSFLRETPQDQSDQSTLKKASQPVPGNKTLATNLMSRAWNHAKELHDVETLGAAKSKARKWASNLLKA